MNEIKIIDTNNSVKAEQKWISKKELMSICNCSDKTIETAVKDLNIEVNFDVQTHMKTGGTEWFVLTKEKLNEIVKKYDFKEVE